MRRFFIYDTYMGISVNDGFLSKATPRYVRYAQQIKLKVELDPSKPESIFPPSLEIDYAAVPTAGIIEDGSDSEATVEFRVEYNMNLAGFWSFASGMFWFFFGMMALFVVA